MTVAPSLRRSAMARSTRSMLCSSALLNSVLFRYSRTTPMRSPSSRWAVAKLAYGRDGRRPTLSTVMSSFGS